EAGYPARHACEQPAQRASNPLAPLRHLGDEIAEGTSALVEPIVLGLDHEVHESKQPVPRAGAVRAKQPVELHRELSPALLEDLDSQVLLALEVVVEVALADLGIGDDVVNAGCQVSVPVKLLQRDEQNLLST